MKKKIAILLSLLLVVIPFQRQNSIKASNYNAAQNVVAEYCELTATWGNRSSKEIKIPFTIRQNINGIIENEVIITNEYECLTMTPYYDMWEDNVITNDSFSYAEIKEENSISFTQLRINDQSMRNEEIRSTTRRHLTSYISKVDNDGPIIDDSRVNYEYQLGEVITEEDITDFILCMDQINDAEGHIINCNFERIENFENVDTNTLEDYPITIVYSDNYGNETSLEKQILIVDNSKPILKQIKILYFFEKMEFHDFDLSKYFEIESNVEIIDLSSNIGEISFGGIGEFELKITLTNTDNQKFYYSYVAYVGDSEFVEGKIYVSGLYNQTHYVFQNSDIKEYSEKLESELMCIYDNQKDICIVEVNLSNVDTSIIGSQQYDITVKSIINGEYFEEYSFTHSVYVKEIFEESIINEEELKEQVNITDYTINGVDEFYLLGMFEDISVYDYLDNATCENLVLPNDNCEIITVNFFDRINTKELGTYVIEYVIENENEERIIVERNIRVADIERPNVVLDPDNQFVKGDLIVVENHKDQRVTNLDQYLKI